MSEHGAYTETKEATEEIQKICDEVKSQVEVHTKKKYEEFGAVQYRKQVVSGTNFLIKVKVGGNNYNHVKVFEELLCRGGKDVVHGVEENHGKEDPIVPF